MTQGQRPEAESRPGAPEEVRRVVLRRGGQTPRLVRAPPPRSVAGHVRARTLLVGIDGTDEEVIQNPDTELPPGEDELVLGHECLAEILDAPGTSGFEPGDRVVPVVRHGCGLCALCGEGKADMCATSRYTEHGIKGLHGFLRDEWTDDPATLVKVPAGLGDEAVLAEPLSVVVKALDVVGSIQRRVPGHEGLRGQRVLLAGTGSLGSLAAFELAAEGAQVWALDRSPGAAAGPTLLRRLGARHVNAKETDLHELAREAGGFDLVLEATGSPRVAFDALLTLRENGIMCMMGVPAQKPAIPVEADDVMRGMVLRNQCLVGSVNSNARHIAIALQRLKAHKGRWGGLLEGVLTHRFSPEECVEAFRAGGEGLVKKAIDWRGS